MLYPVVRMHYNPPTVPLARRIYKPLLLLRRNEIVQGCKCAIAILPSFASGCSLSSSTWYSSPIAEPLLPSDKRNKIFHPAVGAGCYFKIERKIKCAELFFGNNIASIGGLSPSDGSTESTPSFICHPFAGNESLYAPVQPVEVFPSNSSRQPFFFS